MNHLEEYLRKLHEIRSSGGAVTETARRLVALILLGSKLDGNYSDDAKGSHKW